MNSTQAASLSAVLWDMDGTLLDSEPMHQRSLLSVLGIPAMPETLCKLLTGNTDAKVYELCRAHYDVRLSLAQWVQARLDYYREHAHQLQARPGAMEVAQALAAQGIAQAVVSNADRPVLDINLRVLGLHWPSVSRAEVSQGKPDPEPYLKAAQNLRVKAENCLGIEDSVPGAVAVLRANMQLAYWPESHNAPQMHESSIADILPPWGKQVAAQRLVGTACALRQRLKQSGLLVDDRRA